MTILVVWPEQRANMTSFNCCPKRYLTITLTSLGMLVSHAMRVNMAITVVTILDAMPHSKVGTDQARDSVSGISQQQILLNALEWYSVCYEKL